MFDLKALLHDEKTLGKNPYYSYRKEQLEEINNDILSIRKVEQKDSLRQDAIALEFDNRNSIVLTFIAGRINLLLNPHEAQVRLNNLMNEFHGNRNYACAAYVASIILEAVETPYPLRVLGEIAESQGETEKEWEYYERYVRCNSTDTDIIIRVADNYERKGDTKAARNFWQRALTRLLNAPDTTKTRSVFTRLVENGTTDYSFYSSYLSKLGQGQLSTELSRILLKHLLSLKESFSDGKNNASLRKNMENIVEVCRNILTVTPEDTETREILASVLKERYGAYSRFPELSKLHDVTRNGRNPVQELDSFLKEIAYSKNTYVLQNSTGKVGLIMDVDAKGIVTVRFSNRPGDEVKINVAHARSSLTALSSMDFRAIKKGKKTEVIRKKILGEGGSEWLLKTLLFSSPNKTSQLKDMKAEVVPQILNEKEWENVNREIKKIVTVDPYIDVLSKTAFHLRDYPSTLEERTYETFMGYKEFGKRVEKIMEATTIPSFDFLSDSFLDMVRYFSDFLRDERNSIATRIEALLVIEALGELGIAASSDITFEELYSPLSLQEKKNVYDELTSKDIRKTYINLVSTTDRKCYDVLEVIFPLNPTKELMKKMKSVNSKKFNDYMARSLSSYKENIIAFCFFVECGIKKEDLKALKIREEDFVETELNALSFLFRSYADDRQRKALREDLVAGGRLRHHLESASEENVKAAVSHLIWNPGLTDEEKEGFKALVLSRFPHFDFGGHSEEEVEENVTVSVHKGFMCVKSSFDRMQAELIDIKENQIPHTLHEIKTARELGDLRENSEYQYAKEHKIFLDRQYEKLATELSSVKIMSPSDVVDGLVGFGTRVTLEDSVTGRSIVYTFFGRWESDPDNNVIDINAPIGQALMDRKEGETASFSLGGKDFSYVVKKIEKLDF